jgi:hypothetical protein
MPETTEAPMGEILSRLAAVEEKVDTLAARLDEPKGSELARTKSDGYTAKLAELFKKLSEDDERADLMTRRILASKPNLRTKLSAACEIKTVNYGLASYKYTYAPKEASDFLAKYQGFLIAAAAEFLADFLRSRADNRNKPRNSNPGDAK